LLSLTSCSITTHEDLVLPIEPMPSTFYFSFQGTHKPTAEMTVEFDLTVARNRLEEQNNLTGQLPEESRVDATFDVAEIDPPTPVSKIQATPVPDTSESHASVMEKEELIASDCPQPHESQWSPESLMPGKCILPLHEPCSRIRAPEESLALIRLKAMMEEETATLDRILGCLAIVGVGLLGLLVWSGFQLYRSKKDEERMKDIRESIQRKILLQSAIKTTGLEPRSLDSMLKLAESPQRAVTTGGRSTEGDWDLSKRSQVQVSNETLGARNNEVSGSVASLSQPVLSSAHLSSDHPKAPSPVHDARPQVPVQVTPPREPPIQCIALQSIRTKPGSFTTLSQPVSSSSDPSSCTSKVPSPVQHDPYVQVQVTPPRESPILGRQSISTKPYPMDRKDLAQGSSSGILEVSTKADKENLSPCSKLALEWSERKTLRRNNRKKHNKLKPFSANRTTEQNQTISSQSRSHSLSPLDIEPFLAPPPLQSTARGSTFETQLSARRQLLQGSRSDETLTISNKSAIHHNDTVTISNKSAIHHNDTVDSKGFLIPQKTSRQLSHQQIQRLVPFSSSGSPSSAPPLPDLVCTTPGSADSFIEDYW
jgi:hypothetical protein